MASGRLEGFWRGRGRLLEGKKGIGYPDALQDVSLVHVTLNVVLDVFQQFQVVNEFSVFFMP